METYLKTHRSATLFILTVILLCGTFLRLYRITGVPAGISQDEVVTGYDAYSIMLTGHDHHGAYLPITLQTFNDWVSHQTIYFWQFFPLFKTIGLTPFSVRLPYALYAVLQLPLFFILGYVLTRNITFSLLSTFIAIFSYYGIMGRIVARGFVSFYVILALTFFFIALENKKFPLLFFCISGLLFGISIWSYPSVEGFLPIWLLATTGYLILKRNSYQNKNLILHLFVLGFSCLMIVTPLFWDQFTHPERITTRLSQVSIFAHSPLPLVSFVYNYLSYIAPKPLFLPGEVNPIRALPGFGYENMILGIFFYVGLFVLLFQKKKITILFPAFDNQKVVLIIFFLLTLPLVSSLTFPAGNFERIPQFFPIMVLLITLGIIGSYQLLIQLTHHSKTLLYIIGSAIFFMYLFYEFKFFSYYFGPDYEGITQWYYQNGLERVVKYMKSKESEYQTIIVDNVINQPYIYILFYNKVDPKTLPYDDFSVVNLQTKWLSVQKYNTYRFQPVGLDDIKDAEKIHREYNSPVSDYVFYRKDKNLIVKLEMTVSPQQFHRLVPVLY